MFSLKREGVTAAQSAVSSTEIMSQTKVEKDRLAWLAAVINGRVDHRWTGCMTFRVKFNRGGVSDVKIDVTEEVPFLALAVAKLPAEV